MKTGDPLDVLGHKLLLEQLSNQSLLRLIRKFNRNHNETPEPEPGLQ